MKVVYNIFITLYNILQNQVIQSCMLCISVGTSNNAAPLMVALKDSMGHS